MEGDCIYRLYKYMHMLMYFPLMKGVLMLSYNLRGRGDIHMQNHNIK